LLAGLLALVAAAAAQAVTVSGRRDKAKATLDAAKELAAIRLPRGSRKVPGDQSIGHVFRRPTEVCLTPYLVDDAGFWRVPGKPSSVRVWISKHPPPHVTVVSTGWVPRSVVFEFPTQRGVPYRYLQVAVAAAKGGGSAVRGDGEAIWVPRRGLPFCGDL
jgi:hypothetical protein